MASQITSLTIVYLIVYLGADQTKYHSSALLALCAGNSPVTTGLCVGNSPVTGEFPAQRASNAENVSISWRHHVDVGKSHFAVVCAVIITNQFNSIQTQASHKNGDPYVIRNSGWMSINTMPKTERRRYSAHMVWNFNKNNDEQNIWFDLVFKIVKYENQDNPYACVSPSGVIRRGSTNLLECAISTYLNPRIIFFSK